MEAMTTALTPDREGDCTDYTLNTDSAWITVDGISVYIRRTGSSVIVELYKKGDEASGDTIDHASASRN